MQVKTAPSKTAATPQLVFLDDALTIPAGTTKTITAFVDLSSRWNTTRTKNTIGEVYGNRKSADSPLHVDNM